MQVAVNCLLGRLLTQDLEQNNITSAQADKVVTGWREVAKRSYQKQSGLGWTNIGSEFWRDVLGSEYYVFVIRYLLDNRVMLRTGGTSRSSGFSSGKLPGQTHRRPKACKLLEGYRSIRKSEFWTLRHKPTIRRQTRQRRCNIRNTDEVGQLLMEWLKAFRIDATPFLDNDDRMDAWTIESVAAINRADHFAIRDTFAGRFHSPFTQVRSSVRQHIITDSGTPTRSGDVSSCQPLLLGLSASLLEKVGDTKEVGCLLGVGGSFCLPRTADLSLWIELCESGMLYSEIQRLSQNLSDPIIRGRNWIIDVRELSRKRFKRQVLQVVMDRHDSAMRHPLWQVLDVHFPTITQTLAYLKTKPISGKTSYINAAKILQRLESEIMLSKIAKRHAGFGLPIVTIHDEIITPNPNLSLKICREVFSEIGLNPMIKGLENVDVLP